MRASVLPSAPSIHGKIAGTHVLSIGPEEMRTPHILIVDDDAYKRGLIRITLAKTLADATFTELASGLEAQSYFSDPESPELTALVVDYRMSPVDGLKLTRWVRALPSDIPILMVTGHPEIEEQALDAGVDEVLNFLQFSKVGETLLELLETKAASVNRQASF